MEIIFKTVQSLSGKNFNLLPLKAVAAGERPDMYPLVVFQNGAAAELLGALLTMEGRLPCVDAHVNLVRCPAAESGVASVAVERFFTCVLHNVSPQLALGSKLLGAVVASVHQQFLLQVQVRLFNVTTHRPGGG